MKTEVILEQSAITLTKCDWEHSYSRDISFQELRNSSIGDEFTVDGNICGRGVTDETLRIIYKASDGVAGLLSVEYTSDEPNPIDSEGIKLIWFSYA